MECEEISRRLDVQKSFRSIVKGLNRSPSTISRGGRRNGGGQAYRAACLDQWSGTAQRGPNHVSLRSMIHCAD
ncbi:helix-turn-helix domain-containing protein [Thalassospira alkalitolerans]|uniref:helix-turn-helix domain-containing protein n=1 Tax=Thalassospira alkalitolerans TaxID=1293890 RepID=UPI003AA7D2FC